MKVIHAFSCLPCQNGMPIMHVNWPCGFLDGLDRPPGCVGETTGCSRHERICQGTVLLLILNYQRTSLDSIEKNIMVYAWI